MPIQCRGKKLKKQVPCVDTAPFVPGMIIGLTLAVPVGPIALMCIRRSIAEGRSHGIVSGLGVATADSFYAAVTVIGLTAISGFILSRQDIFRILACIVLILAGITISRTTPAEISLNLRSEPYFKDYLSMLVLANPLTLVFFGTILPGFDVVLPQNSTSATMIFVLGVFCGSTLWGIILCGSLGSVRSLISTRHLRLISRISGLVIAAFGAGALLWVLVMQEQGIFLF
ncbi:MAG: lysine transporter LysE [Methanoregula sp. SKADARSKE-2]|nr:MAG: lysine transporter LysE [Methanoregula sp. SKADARSKE-2]